MKVLIVDDEKHVREGIRLLGEWEEHGVTDIYEAANGEEAMEIIQSCQPAIIFTDMKMPKMDGIQLLEWVKEHHPTSKVIVVTGYDDYHYMRKAIHYGSADYLLKPVDPDILNQTLQTVVDDWKKDAAERKQKESTAQLINTMKPVYRDRKLTQLINNDREGLAENYFAEFGFHLSRSYQVAILRVSGKTFEAFEGDRDLTYFTILNVINELVLQNDFGIGFRYLSHKGEIVIIFWDQSERMEATLIQIYKNLKKTMDISCPVAIGIIVNDRYSLKDSYQHAKQLLLHYNLLEQKTYRVYGQGQKGDIGFSPPTTTPLKNLMDYTASIDVAVQAGKIEAFTELIAKVEADFTEHKMLSYKQLLHLENEYLVISNRWFQTYQFSIPVTENVELRVDQFFDHDGMFDLNAYRQRKVREVTCFLRKVKRRSRRKQTNIIYEIETYLQANFDRDVKLQEISEHFYISREYISRKFKQEFHVTISDYILKIRMRKAKSLLENSDLRIYEIAGMIGYQDDKYFRKVFKKIEGITPNEYRAQFEEVKK